MKAGELEIENEGMAGAREGVGIVSFLLFCLIFYRFDVNLFQDKIVPLVSCLYRRQ